MRVARKALAAAGMLAFGITAPIHSEAKARIYTLLPNTACRA